MPTRTWSKRDLLALDRTAGSRIEEGKEVKLAANCLNFGSVGHEQIDRHLLIGLQQLGNVPT